MDIKQLIKYPKLTEVLSPRFHNEIKHILNDINPKTVSSHLTHYSFFIALTESESNYTALDILSNEEKLNQQLQSFIGFIYSGITEIGKLAQYNTIRVFKKVFTALASQKQFTVLPISVSQKVFTHDALHCLQLFNSLPINEVALNYYSGWTCRSKEDTELYLHLAPFRDCYGEGITQKFHQAICNYANTTRTTTLRNTSKHLVRLLNLLPKHCATPEQLEQRLKPHNSVRLMEELMLGFFLLEQVKGNDSKSSIKLWRAMITTFAQCFIDSGIFATPLTQFITPEWREPINNQHSISVGGDLSEAEIDRWLVNIPLSIKDDQALEVIHHRLKQDIKHIRLKSHKMVECIKQRHQRNSVYIQDGKVKPLPTKTGKANALPMGVNNIANTVATFYHYGFNRVNNYLKFLGFYGQSAILTKELNLPTLETLNAFITLLILEHPKITPSWLDQWELFDKHGNQVGFFQSGKQWLIKSFKNRRGATLAQQEIILTPYSKSLVEALIEHTAFTRATLKRQGDSIHRFMVLSCPSATKQPKRYTNIGSSLIEDRRYHQKLAEASFDSTPPLLPLEHKPIKFKKLISINPTIINRLLTQPEAHELAQIVTPRAIRKSQGLQIYLETRSLRAVSDALGHTHVDTDLLAKYLPAPLMDFFNARWVRQFQNAIIYEALKDSPLLFDALDFSEKDLVDFLNNHGLGTMPEHLSKVKEQGCLATNEEHSNNIDELVFTLSTPLFQVLIALKQVITNARQEDTFKPEIKNWFEVSEFILSQFSTSGKSSRFYKGDKECDLLYQKALENPLPLTHFKESLLCH